MAFTITLNLNPSIYAYYYTATDSVHANSTTEYFLEVKGSVPYIENAGVSPPSGTIGPATFNFTATYIDIKNNTPVSFAVVINGTSYPMVQANMSDTSYVSGVEFTVSVVLGPGTYSYYFNASNAYHSNSTTTNLLEVKGSVPFFENPNVNPPSGTIGPATFNFTATYLNAKNSTPVSFAVVINGTVYPMVQANMSDTSYVSGVEFTVSVVLGPGTYFYYFNASNAYHSNSTTTNLLEVKGSVPFFENPNVNPPSGTIGPATFNFTATYLNAKNSTPVSFAVVINGIIHPMVQANTSDTSYVSGVEFTVSVLLGPGTYSYYFNASNAYHLNSTTTYELEVNGSVPFFENGIVTPPSGTIGPVTFTFTVTYVDAKNSTPVSFAVVINGTVYLMVQANASDTSYMSGVEFTVSVLLGPGTYSYYFNASNAYHSNSTSINVLTVNQISPVLAFFESTNGIVTLAIIAVGVVVVVVAIVVVRRDRKRRFVTASGKRLKPIKMGKPTGTAYVTQKTQTGTSRPEAVASPPASAAMAAAAVAASAALPANYICESCGKKLEVESVDPATTYDCPECQKPMLRILALPALRRAHEPFPRRGQE